MPFESLSQAHDIHCELDAFTHSLSERINSFSSTAEVQYPKNIVIPPESLVARQKKCALREVRSFLYFDSLSNYPL